MHIPMHAYMHTFIIYILTEIHIHRYNYSIYGGIMVSYNLTFLGFGQFKLIKKAAMPSFRWLKKQNILIQQDSYCLRVIKNLSKFVLWELKSTTIHKMQVWNASCYRHDSNKCKIFLYPYLYLFICLLQQTVEFPVAICKLKSFFSQT